MSAIPPPEVFTTLVEHSPLFGMFSIVAWVMYRAVAGLWDQTLKRIEAMNERTIVAMREINNQWEFNANRCHTEQHAATEAIAANNELYRTHSAAMGSLVKDLMAMVASLSEMVRDMRDGVKELHAMQRGARKE